MAVDEQVLRDALEGVIAASGALRAARATKASADAALTVASGNVDVAQAAESDAHVELDARVAAVVALLDQVDD